MHFPNAPSSRHIAAIALIILALNATGCSAAATLPTPPTAVKGSLDLSSWDFHKNGIIELAGEWEFHWGRLLQPKDLAGPGPAVPAEYLVLPGIWNDQVRRGVPLGPLGMATLRLRLTVQDSGGPYTLRMPEMSNAYRLWIDGIMVHSDRGMDTLPPGAIIQRFWPNLISFTPSGRTFDIVLQVANALDSRGGIQYGIRLGPESMIQAERDRSLIVDSILAGVLTIMSLYHFGLFITRRKERASLWFSIFCFLIAARSINVDEQILNLMLPAVPWAFCVKLEHITMYLGLPAMAFFISTLYPDETLRAVSRSILAAGFIAALTSLVLPMRYNDYLIIPYQLVIILSIVYYQVALIRAAMHGRELATLLALAYLLLALAVVNDILYDMRIIDTTFMAPLGMIVMVFCQSFVLTVRFVRAFQRVEVLSEELSVNNRIIEDYSQNLEGMVEERMTVITSQKKELDNQLDMARKIQQSILPSTFPSIAGARFAYRYTPMMQIGGDFLDYHYKNGQELAVFIGDVSGHGIAGAFLAAMVKMTLAQAWERHSHEPAAVLEEIRHSLAGKMGGHFLTACVLHVDLATGAMTSATAGHPPMIIIRSDGTLYEIPTGGHFIAENIEAKYALYTTVLNQGDRVVLYTDGITEAYNDRRKMFGSEGLLRSVGMHQRTTPDEFCDAVFDDVMTFIGTGRGIDDDITLFMMEYR